MWLAFNLCMLRLRLSSPTVHAPILFVFGSPCENATCHPLCLCHVLQCVVHRRLPLLCLILCFLPLIRHCVWLRVKRKMEREYFVLFVRTWLLVKLTLNFYKKILAVSFFLVHLFPKHWFLQISFVWVFEIWIGFGLWAHFPASLVVGPITKTGWIWSVEFVRWWGVAL